MTGYLPVEQPIFFGDAAAASGEADRYDHDQKDWPHNRAHLRPQ
jgi:hypothetical protein